MNPSPSRTKPPAPRKDRVANLPLALREVTGNLAVAAEEVTAWFLLDPQTWSFRSDSQRESLVTNAAQRLVGLAGHRLHLRVTSRPYPVRVWAEGLDRLTPAPLPGSDGRTWADYLVGSQEHLAQSTLADKEVYLGVRLSGRTALAGLLERVGRGAGKTERDRLLADAARVAEIVAGPGLEGRPATAAQMEWLLRRSIGLGLPAPTVGPEVADWHPEDLHALSDVVDYQGSPLGRTVKVTGWYGSRQVERHVAVLSLGRVDEWATPENGKEPWMALADRLPFPVEWSCRVDVLSGEQAKGAVNRKLLVIRDQQGHYAEHGLDVPLDLARKAGRAIAVEDEMLEGADLESTRAYGWHRLAVAGRTEEEVLERVRQVTNLYRTQARMTLEHPRGQHALVREFTPAQPLASTAYRRRLTALYFAAGMPAVTSQVGDRRGPVLGRTAGGAGRRAVMLDTHFATEVRERSGLIPVTGGLGAGKSVVLGSVCYQAVRRGIGTTILDPSGPMGRLAALPEFAGRARHIDLTHAEPGTLNPYAVVAQPRRRQYDTTEGWEAATALAVQDRKALALDVLRMLLPPQVDAMPESRLVLQEAIRAVGGHPGASPWQVVETLEASASEHGRVLAGYLRDVAEMPQARLIFPVAGVAIRDHDDTLLVLTMPGIVLPDLTAPRETWSSEESLSVPMLHLASYYASRRIYSRDRNERKMIALDETHFLAGWASGRALFNRLARDSRKWNACVLAASQNPGDVLGHNVANFLSTVLVGRTEDEEVARDALRMLRVPVGVGYERVLAGLSPQDRRSTARSGPREFVMRDVDGNVEKVVVDLGHLPGLLEALDTTADPTRTRPSLEAVPA